MNENKFWIALPGDKFVAPVNVADSSKYDFDIIDVKIDAVADTFDNLKQKVKENYSHYDGVFAEVNIKNTKQLVNMVQNLYCQPVPCKNPLQVIVESYYHVQF